MFKSSYALGYNKATENVTITNCIVSGYDVGTLYNGTYQRKEAAKVPDRMGPTGRIKLGTESNGGFKNISISNCVFDYCRGLALETVDGALLEDVVISNITMKDIINAPLYLRLGARMRGPEGTSVGRLQRVMISNINVYNANSDFASIISGVPGGIIEDIQLNNIHIWYRGMDSAISKIPVTVPENEKTYPEPARMGVMPAYGFYIRHVNGIAMNNVQVNYLGNETRPAIIMDDVRNAQLFRIQLQPVTGTDNIILKNIEQFSIKNSEGFKDKKIKQSSSASL